MLVIARFLAGEVKLGKVVAHGSIQAECLDSWPLTRTLLQC